MAAQPAEPCTTATCDCDLRISLTHRMAWRGDARLSAAFLELQACLCTPLQTCISHHVEPFGFPEAGHHPTTRYRQLWFPWSTPCVLSSPRPLVPACHFGAALSAGAQHPGGGAVRPAAVPAHAAAAAHGLLHRARGPLQGALWWQLLGRAVCRAVEGRERNAVAVAWLAGAERGRR